MRTIRWLVVHNNGVAGRTIEDIRRTHKAKGWKDVGYHYVYHEDGSEHVGRPEEAQGAHVAGLNRNTIGLCVVGNGNKQDFNPAQYDALIGRLVDLLERHNLSPKNVIGHRETRSLVQPSQATKKTCPGTKVDMEALRARLRELEKAGIVPETEASPAPRRRPDQG